ncbi:MAG: M28 family peptidase, partial [Chitinispirillaceae bacterium]
NRAATDFFQSELSSLGWNTQTPEFDVVDWKSGGAELRAGGADFEVLPSPYSLGCSITAELASASNISELENGDFRDKLLFVYGPLAREQLMPKNFVFYNPEEHQKIVSLLEKSGAGALICATGRNGAVAGGVYPFPLIEDGDFDTPSVYMTEEDGRNLLQFVGKKVSLQSRSERIPSKACNVIGRKGQEGAQRIVITAHIDAKKGTPGAIDNATGVTTLLLLADLLNDYSGPKMLEIVAFNGEDYYSVPGQMNYIMSNQGRFDEILVDINIDGAGYKEGNSAVSFYELPQKMIDFVRKELETCPTVMEGEKWPQGDHSIFLHYGIPAIAATSDWLIKNIEAQSITHTAKDNVEIVDSEKLVELARMLAGVVKKI